MHFDKVLPPSFNSDCTSALVERIAGASPKIRAEETATPAAIAGAGVAIGIALSLGLARLMANLLFSVSAADPLPFAAVAIVLMLIAMLACYIPARRTLRVDPTVALRYE